MLSEEDQIIDGNVAKKTLCGGHSLRAWKTWDPDDGHHTRGIQSSRFEDGHIQNLDPLEIVNVGTVPEKLRQAHVVISAEQKSQGSPGDQQI